MTASKKSSRTRSKPPGFHVCVFPFDFGGNAGCAAGALALGDVIDEITADTALEQRPTRTHEWVRRLHVEQCHFDTIQDLSDWRELGREKIESCLKDGSFTLWLGGNHLSVLPVYEALQSDDLVIQFDAHLDTFDLHDTTPTLSHGNFLCFAESLPKVINMGHRDLIQTRAMVSPYFAEAIPAFAVGSTIPEYVMNAISDAPRVWIDIDVDVFDPSVCPAVHQPLPCGFDSITLVKMLDAIFSTEKIVGVSISEFDPGRDHREMSLNLLGWLVEWLFGRAHDSDPAMKS